MGLPKEHARTRVLGDDYLETLVNSVTLDQLRSTLLALKIDEPARTRHEAIDRIYNSGRDAKEVEQLLLRIEAGTPQKHCVISRLSAPPELSAFESTPYKFSNDDKFGLKLVYISQEDPLLLTVEHHVPVSEWVAVDSDNRKRVTNTIRHQIQVRFYPSESVVLMCFPGFSQGGGIEAGSRIDYPELISALMNQLADTCKISFQSLPIREALETLAEGESHRVRVTAADFDSSLGKMKLSSASQQKSVADMLNGFLNPHATESARRELRSAVDKALSSTTPNSMLCNWADEKVITRIQFWDDATELLFIWHEASKSFRAIETVTKVLAEVGKQLQPHDAANAWRAVVKANADVIFVLSIFASDNKISSEVARSTFMRAVEARLVEPVFRLRMKTGTVLHDRPNEWQSTLRDLQQQFHDDTDCVIDGRDPANIEVAFRRLPALEGSK